MLRADIRFARATREATVDSTTASALDEAVKLHRAGALDEAAARYRAILQREPGNADAQYYLAIVAQQQGDDDQAAARVRGLLATNPNQARAHKLLGMILNGRGERAAALQSFDRAIACDDTLADAHGARADLLAELGRFAEAVEGYRRALALQPDSPNDWCNLGVALCALGSNEEAVASYTRAIETQPNFAEACFNRANALANLERNEEALGDYDRALALAPAVAEIHNNRGNVLLKLGRVEEAARSFDAALAVNPGLRDALVSSATALSRLGRPQDALERCDQALAIRPDASDALTARAAALLALDRQDEALRDLDRVLASNPDDAKTNWNAAVLALLLGRLEEGWARYAYRWIAMPGLRRKDYPQPEWDGRPFDGTLLVWGEQGLGDQIIYGGMLPELAGRARRVVLEVEPRLVPLFARSFPGIEVVAERPEPQLYAGPVDRQIAFGSLGRHLRRSLAEFPRRDRGYLAADPARVRALRERLAGDGRNVVGISWISKAETGRFKTAELQELQSVLRLPNVRIVDLQYGDTREERERIERELGLRVERLPDVDTTADIDGLAALIGACDAVVTVSNTTAHLAGALGVPTWVVVPFGQARIWYWFKEGDTSPWYPRVRVLRQKAGQRWYELFAVAAAEVRRAFDKP